MTHPYVSELARMAGIPEASAARVTIQGSDPLLRTPWRVAETGAASIAAASLAAAELYKLRTGVSQDISVDCVSAAAALKGNHYMRIDGKTPPRPRDPVTGFYQLKDGRWIYLHCNFPNLRDKNLGVLGAPPEREAIASRVAQWDGIALEKAIFAAGGCCAFVRSEEEWLATEQAAAVSSEPLFEIFKIGDAPVQPLPEGDRPLSGIRALDLTRVLAGPTCGRTFAEHGAEVMRVSRADLPDSGIFDLDTGMGKLASFIDLREEKDRAAFRALIAKSDIFLQSYRPGALAGLGFSFEDVARIRPGVVCVTLDAWGFTGPWKDLRGYDTAVQSGNGFAFQGLDKPPQFMPVSAQDYIGGYLMAFASMVALHRRATIGGSWLVRVSLARVGEWLRSKGRFAPEVWQELPTNVSGDKLQSLLMESDSPVGRLTHLAPPSRMSVTQPHWVRPAVPLGTHAPVWPEA